MKRDHRENTVGPWAQQKLAALEQYLEFYGTALSKQNFRRVYIDAFAGACVAKIRNSDVPPEPSPFFDDPEASNAQEQFILGSPIRALNIKHPFHKHYFFDLDESRAEELGTVTEGRRDVEVKVGDCNPLIRSLIPQLKSKSVRGVAFLDPYGAHLEWETLEALASTGTMEVVVNFPVAMAINRLITRSGEIPEKWSAQLDRCFGTPEWREVAYHRTLDLFGEEVTTKKEGVADDLLQLYLQRLRKVFSFVAPPRLIRNTRQSPLYYLLWAGPNELGLKVAAHILAQGEKLGAKIR
jgi:three-Cys-motif partner protein